MMFKVSLGRKYHKDFTLTHFNKREGNNREFIPDVFNTGKLVKMIVDLPLFCFVLLHSNNKLL